ncbi:MAG: hypothetical protein IT258_08905 [Saprospiraceae bacterium]|nr:hypothetical protein [Saprospiraceae bacterium]
MKTCWGTALPCPLLQKGFKNSLQRKAKQPTWKNNFWHGAIMSFLDFIGKNAATFAKFKPERTFGG